MIFSLVFLICSEQNLLIHYDFQDVSEKTVKDKTGNNNDGTLQNEATIYSMGKYKVLNLGNGAGYLDMGAKSGETFASTNDFTISIYYRVHEEASLDNNGRFLWTFSTLESNEANSGVYSGYRLNAQRFATSTGGYDHEHGMEIGSQSTKGRWMHVAYTQTGKIGKFYINGIEKMSNEDMPINTENWATKPAFNWIGRAAFSWDSYLVNTLVYDFRLYNSVLSPSEISSLSDIVYDLDSEYMFGDSGNRTHFDQLVSDSKEFLAGDTSKYLNVAVQSLKDLVSYCESLQTLEKLSQPFLDQLYVQLDNTRRIVEASESSIFGTVKVSEKVYDTNRGFVHPGGIHTEEDFSRVRQQISEGNEKVVQAFDLLKRSEWSQLTTNTYPVEVIIRGEGAQNYINAARGAHIAYQNALRWKLESNDDFARHGVNCLMSWARVCKAVSGNSNWALAAGIYGYEFAQAAEILRTFEGWSSEDFNFFKDWMIRVWALPCYSFLSGRLGTWENSGFIPAVGHGTDGQRPGHYWSNWGLCNCLALQSIAVLCDDVFLYNQAISFYKYDQTTQANWNTETDLFNRGVMEYIDNLVPYVSEYETEKGAYGKIGQMQESGRDQGHATFSAGLAVDICMTAWNQGDDLFSYHDNRLAAGIEFIAAYNNANDDNLPFKTYHYASCRTAWHNAEIHNGPSGTARGQTRPYWGKIIGHYEGVKGVTLHYADMAYQAMGVDGGCYGSASGGYDHFGFSVLMNTRSGTASANEVPTLLTPKIEYNGEIIEHNELGGLTNNFMFMKNKAVPRGGRVKLMPQLPSGARDTGKWKWNTQQTTKDITVTTDKSYVYRATYTNENNVQSHQVFMISVDGDCIPSSTSSSAYVNGALTDANGPINVYLDEKVTLRVDGNGEWGSYVLWDNGAESSDITLYPTNDISITAKYINHCGATNLHTFDIKVNIIKDRFFVNDDEIFEKSSQLVNIGDNIKIKPFVSPSVANKKFVWNDGRSNEFFDIPNIQTTTKVSLQIQSPIKSSSKDYRFIVIGNKEYDLQSDVYIIRDIQSGRVLTNDENDIVTFADPKVSGGKYDPSQVWTVQQERNESSLRYLFSIDNKYININGSTVLDSPCKFQLWNAEGTNELIVYDENKEFLWEIDSQGKVSMDKNSDLYGYPFSFEKYQPSSDSKKKNKGGMIAGIVIAVVVVIAIVVVAVIFVIRKKNNEKTSDVGL